jgi:putative ABC transport system ATP-binding protein
MVIELDSLGKLYSTGEVRTHALTGIGLTIERGEYVAIEGPPGSGKSTLLSLLGLLDSSTSGTYKLNGKDVSRQTPSERSRVRNREIGFISQNFNVIGDLTVAENVELPLTYRGLSANERRRRVAEALERVGVAHHARHFPAQLSDGQQQRVAIARAIAGEPSVLLADEPTGNLDSNNGEGVMALLSDLHESGSTIVMVTHDRRFDRDARRVVRLLDGRIVSDAANAESDFALASATALRIR